ncbi:MAG TPA: N-acetylmuramoyl-L-alanine amidase [Chthoniobacterales bacterium]|nr:N-acetylmuramoyl-L-alanine amidase [Chthoniobacterales bacterium]
MLKKVVFCTVLSAAAAVTSGASDWTVIKQQNRDYVTFSNVAHFYNFPEYTRVSHTVSLRSDRRGIRAQAGTSELFINGVRFVTDFPILTNGEDELISAMDVSKIIEPIMRPNRLRNARKIQTVILDPGHGGADNGASNRWGTEKMFALDVAMHARSHLQRAGYKVEMTRTRDNTVSLEDRVRIANKFRDAVFVSIHFNYSGSAEGLETYALAPEGVPSNAFHGTQISAADVRACPGNIQDEHNIALSAAIHAMVLTRLSMFDRGVKHARFHVLRDVKIPAVLVECGFLSNSAEGQRIATAQFRQDVAAAIAQGVQNYDAAVNFRGGGATFASAKKTLPAHTQSITEPLSDSIPEARYLDQPSISISAGP